MNDVTLPASMVPDVLHALATVAQHYRQRIQDRKATFDRLLNDEAPEEIVEIVEAELVEYEDVLDRYLAAHSTIQKASGATPET